MWRIEVKHINVKQGDSALLFFYENNNTAPCRTVLIDGGESTKILRSFLTNKLTNCLDAVILTHPDQDHIVGIKGLLDAEKKVQQYLKATYLYDQGVIRYDASATNKAYTALIQQTSFKNLQKADIRKSPLLTERYILPIAASDFEKDDKTTKGDYFFLGFELLWNFCGVPSNIDLILPRFNRHSYPSILPWASNC